MFKIFASFVVIALATGSAFAGSDSENHYYVMKDGTKYGYAAAISEQEKAAGIGATKLTVFRYLGKKDKTIQIETQDGDFHSVLECTVPCEHIKVMQFYGDDHVDTEYLQSVPGTIGWMAMRDAIYGNLEQTTFERPEGDDTVTVSIWVTEENGPIYTPLSE